MSKDIRFLFDSMPKNHSHAGCKKNHQWYATCEEVWSQAKILAIKLKPQKGGKKYTTSDLIDDLITEKSEEVFSRTQK